MSSALMRSKTQEEIDKVNARMKWLRPGVKLTDGDKHGVTRKR